MLKLLERTDDGKTVVGCKNPDSSDLVSLALSKACLPHVHLQKVWAVAGSLEGVRLDRLPH